MGATKTIGTILRKTSAPTATISDNTTMGGIGVESDEVDVTTLDSTGGFKEFIAGAKDAGEFPLAGYIKTEANMEDMLALAISQTTETWEMELPNGAIWFFTAFVKSWKETEASVEGVRGFEGVLRISGQPVYASTGISA